MNTKTRTTPCTIVQSDVIVMIRKQVFACGLKYLKKWNLTKRKCMSVIGSVIFQMQWRSYDILSDNLLLPYLKRNKSTATCNFVYRLIMHMFFQASFISKTMENMYQTQTIMRV